MPKVVLLEDEPQSEVQSALEQVIIKNISVHCCINLSLDKSPSSQGCHVPFTEEWILSGHYHTGLIGIVLQKWLSFWMVLSLQSNAGALVTIGFLVTSLTNAGDTLQDNRDDFAPSDNPS